MLLWYPADFFSKLSVKDPDKDRHSVAPDQDLNCLSADETRKEVKQDFQK